MSPDVIVEQILYLITGQLLPHQYAIEAALELAGVNRRDVVFDLGCNDGRRAPQSKFAASIAGAVILSMGLLGY
jgi:hypothetical protein